MHHDPLPLSRSRRVAGAATLAAVLAGALAGTAVGAATDAAAGLVAGGAVAVTSWWAALAAVRLKVTEPR
jgi:hypothetical protein